LIRLAVIIFTIFVSTLFAIEQKSILWVEYDLPPVYIVDGKLKGEGYAQSYENDIRKALKEFTHEIEVTSIPRKDHMQKNLPNVCSSIIKTKEREAYLYFTKPLYLLVPNGLIFRREDMRKYEKFQNSEGALNLKKMLDSSELKIGYVHGRSYGKLVDSYLGVDKSDDNLIELTKVVDNQILLLTKSRRIDTYFAYPNEANFHADMSGVDRKAIKYLPLVDSQYVTAYIACSKTEMGKEIISKIDSYIGERREKELLEHYLRWIDEEDAKKIRGHADDEFKRFDQIDEK